MKQLIYGLMTATFAWFTKGSTPFFSLPKQAMEFATNVSKLVDSIPTLTTKVDTLTEQLIPLVKASSGSGLFSKVLAATSQFLANFWLPLVVGTTLLGGILVTFKGLDVIFTCFNAVTHFFGTAGDALSSFFVEGPKEVLRSKIEELLNSVKDSLERHSSETIAEETKKLLTDFLKKHHEELLKMYTTQAQALTNFPQEMKELLHTGNTYLAKIIVLYQAVLVITGGAPANTEQLPELTETPTELTANGPFGQHVWVDILAVLGLWLLGRFVAKRLSGFFKRTYLRVLVWLGRWSVSLVLASVLLLLLRLLSQGFSWPGPRKGPGLDWTKIGSLVLVYVVRFAKAWWAASVLQFGLRTVLCSPEIESEGSDTEDTEDTEEDRAAPSPRLSPVTVLPPENTRDSNMQQRPRGPGYTQARTHALGDLLRRQLGNGIRGMAANQVSEQPQSGVQAWAEALVRQHGGSEAVQAWAEALVRAPGGSEAGLAREAYHRNLQSHPTLRCLEPFARVGDVAAAQGDLLPRIGAGFTGLPGDLQRRHRLLYEATRAAAEEGGRTAEGGHTIVHQSFVARAWANLLESLESLDFLAQTHELNERVNELGWYLGPLAAVAAGALGYFLFGRSGASAGLPAPSSPPAAPAGPRGSRPAGTAALVTVVRVAEFLVQFFGVTEEGIAEMSNTSP